MKKAIYLTLAIVLTLVLCSCTKGESTMFFIDKDNALADARMEQLFNAIKLQNNDALKELFSKKTVEKTGNIDAGIDDLLSFMQGEVVSWNRDDLPFVEDTVEDGCKTKLLETWYTLDTDEQSYLVLLVDYPIDTIDPENEGLYAIRILRTEYENKLVGTLEDWVIPGVYILDN